MSLNQRCDVHSKKNPSYFCPQGKGKNVDIDLGAKCNDLMKISWLLTR